MYKLCTLCSKLYRVVVNFISWNVGIGSIDDLVENGRDRKWWLIWVASLFFLFFYFCSHILKVFFNIQKNEDFFQVRPNPKSLNDSWQLCTLSLIWWEMNSKIDLWCVSIGI